MLAVKAEQARKAFSPITTPQTGKAPLTPQMSPAQPDTIPREDLMHLTMKVS
jgi:hypothetical protein